jgi:ADP-heptose:LPS heptosyltransferase
MEKITKLEKRLKEIKETFEALKKAGVNEEILLAFIQMRTKMSRRDIKQMLNAQEEFYSNLISKEVADAL